MLISAGNSEVLYKVGTHRVGAEGTEVLTCQWLKVSCVCVLPCSALFPLCQSHI